MLSYVVTLTPDSNDTLLVGVPDIPEANSVGDDEEEALFNAVDAIISALEMYITDRRAVPKPSKPSPGQKNVNLPALETLKVLLWNEMLAQGKRKSDLARALGVYLPQVDRLFDLRHSSKLEFVEQAANVLGKKVTVSLV